MWLPSYTHENAWEAGSCLKIHTVRTNPRAHSTSLPSPILPVVGTERSLASLWDRDSLGKDEVRIKHTGTTQDTRNQFPAAQRLT